jgi:acetamidase/formamidase
MRAELTLSVDLLKSGAREQHWPRVETADALITVGGGCPAEIAHEHSIREMIRWLSDRQGWTKTEARMFLALVGDARPGQLVGGDFTMRMIVPKRYLPG